MDVSSKIDKQIADLPDWRGQLLTRIRKLINESDPNLKEDWKWETAVWTQNGLVCAMSSFKNHVKINFFKGASLSDPKKILNSGLESKSHRSIDLFEDDNIDEPGLKDLVRNAVNLNIKK
jgi:hypothetical protein